MALLALPSDGVRAMAVRMPGTVHDEGQGCFAGLLTDAARRALGWTPTQPSLLADLELVRP